MISISIFSTQADRLFVPCEVMEAEALFFAGVQWAVFPASHAWSCTSNNPGSRQVRSSREGIDLPHQTHHHWHCLSANTCLSVLRPLLTPLYTLCNSIYTDSWQNSTITQSSPSHHTRNLPPCSTSFKFWAVPGVGYQPNAVDIISGVLSSAWTLLIQYFFLTMYLGICTFVGTPQKGTQCMTMPCSCNLLRGFPDYLIWNFTKPWHYIRYSAIPLPLADSFLQRSAVWSPSKPQTKLQVQIGQGLWRVLMRPRPIGHKHVFSGYGKEKWLDKCWLRWRLTQ